MSFDHFDFFVFAVGLGSFVGLDRRFSGARYALSVHAFAGAIGCFMAVVCFGDEFALNDWQSMAIGSILASGLALTLLKRVRESLARSGDKVSLTTAFGVGVSCAAADWRAVAVAVFVAVVVSMFRPRGEVVEATPTRHRLERASDEVQKERAKLLGDTAPVGRAISAPPMDLSGGFAASEREAAKTRIAPLIDLSAARSRRPGRSSVRDANVNGEYTPRRQ
jgi:hypothetical protein